MSGVIMQLGFGMQGHEQAIHDLVSDVICSRFNQVTYVEIGVAHGQTLGGVSHILRDRLGMKNWRGIGIELPDGYSFDRNETFRAGNVNHIGVNFIWSFNGTEIPPWGRITVYMKDSLYFVPEHWKEPIQLALIDGCHCRECATRDFINLEPFIVPGGMVMLHDFGRDQIGQEQAPAAPHRLNGVRAACHDLGLIEGAREGWQFTGELIGDKQAGSANMGVFQKV